MLVERVLTGVQESADHLHEPREVSRTPCSFQRDRHH